MDFLPYYSTPAQEIQHPLLETNGIRLIVKREDLNHPRVSGNKWWKLKYNMLAAKQAGVPAILTFGGAYSNHIYATAAAAHACGVRSIGVIRGQRVLPLNPTLAFAAEQQMNLHFVSREAYRHKRDSLFIESLKKEFGNFCLIPEGGTNTLAVKGCAELYGEVASLDFDKLFLAVGTGGTAAGLIAGGNGAKEVVGVPILKNGSFLHDEIHSLLDEYGYTASRNFRLLTDYHFNGYAKVSSELIIFMKEMKNKYDLPLDPVYTGKLFYGIFEEIKKGNFKRGTSILAIHTGGMQGAASIMNSFE